MVYRDLPVEDAQKRYSEITVPAPASEPAPAPAPVPPKPKPKRKQIKALVPASK
jgi:hypothetical protein